jgi:FHS family L-fucose permease-like MFS transporter
METQKINLKKIAPVLMAFFVMSFCDLVGISVDMIKPIFGLSAFKAQLINTSVFIWFLLISVMVGVLQNKIGKKNMLNIGMVITAIGLFIPYFFFHYVTFLLGFAFLGIGNTIVQVSANPLLISVVPTNRTSSFLSFSQFIKAIGSMIAPWLATKIFAVYFDDWKLLFLVFGIVSILSVIWLGSVKIDETKQESFNASFGTSFRLLGNGFILLMVISIFLVVGIDVGFQSNSGQFLMHHFYIAEGKAVLGRSVYFFGRMLGTFAGAIMLTQITSRKFFMWTSAIGIVALITILIIHSPVIAWALVFIIGLAVANIFPLVFSIAVEKLPSRSNEISGLMIMAVSGGAIIPPLIGWISDISNIVIGMLVLIACMIYLWAVSIYCLKK